MKIELTIKTDYLPSWGVWQGLRELVQNARDAELELGAAMTVQHTGKTLVIENDGCILPHEALLLGHTTKASRSDTIGKFGEGLKLGILALVRGGIPVKIRSGSEVWVPAIQHSEKFNANVLVFYVQGGRKPENRVRIEVEGISAEIWNDSHWKFRFLSPHDDTKAVKTDHGTLLVDDHSKGHVFMKGIYVHTDPKLEFGYDLASGELDRDRKMVERYDFAFRAKDILTYAVAQRPDLMKKFVGALERQSPDVLGIDSQFLAYSSKLNPTAVAGVVEDFRARYGPNAVPVRNLGESKDLDHLGKKGIVVSESLSVVLGQVMPSVHSVKQALSEEVQKSFGWSDLSAAERQSLEEAVDLVNRSGVVETTLDEIEVVQFGSKDLQGLHREGRIFLAKDRLTDPRVTLETLVHECAHKGGASDGDHEHVSRIESIWSGIVTALRTPKAPLATGYVTGLTVNKNPLGLHTAEVSMMFGGQNVKLGIQPEEVQTLKGLLQAPKPVQLGLSVVPKAP